MSNLINRSLKIKLLVLFLSASLLPLFLVSAISYFSASGALKKFAFNNLISVSQGKEESIKRYLRTKIKVTRGFASDYFIRNAVEKLAVTLDVRLAEELSTYIKEEKEPVDPDIELTHVLNLKGKIISSTDKSSIGTDKSNDDYFVGGKKGIHIKDAYISGQGTPAIAVSTPINSKTTGEIIGVLVNRYSTKELNSIFIDRQGLGLTGESYIVNKDGFMITDSRFTKDVFLKQKIDNHILRTFFERNQEGSGTYRDYRGNIVLGAVNGSDFDKEFGLGWGIVAEEDVAEAFAPVIMLRNIMLLIFLLVSALVAYFALMISNSIANPVKSLANTANEISKGNLTVEVGVHGVDEIGILGESFALMLKNLRQILAKVEDAVNQTTSASNEILSASQQQATGAREQSSAINETTSAATELAKSAEQVGENIRQVSVIANHTLAGMAKIKEAIGKTGEKITSLSEKSQQIGKITELINDVADQTNLLAVNAAIEAARAGEEGRGFAVVADEIRKLADSTAKSTKDITALIEIIQHEMSNAIISMEQSVNNVNEETKLAQESAESAKEIAMSATQQVSGSKQIADAMGNINDAMKQISAGASQAQAGAKQLNELAKELHDVTAKFKVS